jgi:hypothetical protein
MVDARLDDVSEGALMPVIPPTPWNDLVNEMQTGDLILFSGTSSESEWIKLFTGGLFSHSTMIYRPDPSQPPLMWQEAPDGIVTDPHTGSLHGGAQLGDALGATEVITNQYLDVPYYVKLNWERPGTLNDTILNVINSYEQRPFGSVLQMALNYAIGHLYNQGTDETSIFCAELVAITFQALGLLDASHPPNWYSPNSFGPSPLDPVPWLQGVSLAAPIELSVPNDGGADVAVAIDVEMTTWPAGPLAPDQLPMPPVLSQALAK